MAAGRTPAEHYTQAQRNEAFYNRIGGSNSSDPEWAVATLFYIAVHELEAALLALGEPSPKRHQDRLAAMRANFRPAASHFETLHKMSVDARYHCKRHAQSDIAFAEARLGFIRQEIAKKAGPPY
jgi:hypothetical protein